MPRPFNYRNNKGFTVIELIISIIILGIVFIGILKAFKETFGVLSYINESINGTYFLRNGVEDLIYIRNDFVNKNGSSGWENFVDNYGSGTFVFAKDGYGALILSGITDLPKNYQGPIDKFGNELGSKTGTYFYRKIDISYEPNSFYLQNITRDYSGTLRLNFSKNVYNESNFLINSMAPLKDENGVINNEGGAVQFSSFGGTFYNIDGSADGFFTNNLLTSVFDSSNKNKLKYSKIFDYSGLSIADGNQFIVYKNKDLSPKDQIGNKFVFEFDNNNSLSYVGTGTLVSIKIGTGSTLLDDSFYGLCSEINKLNFIECRFNKLLKDNFYNKLIGVNKEFSDIDFGSGFTFSFSGTELTVSPGTGNNLTDYNDTKYVNPSYLIRTINNANKFALRDDKSDVTGGKGVKIPNKPNLPGNRETEYGYPSILKAKISIFLYDGDKFIEENNVELKIGDIYRNKINNIN